jgi:hypothetical protein
LLLPMPLNEIAEQAFALDDLIGGAARPLLDAVANAPDDSARIRLLETELVRRCGLVHSPAAARAVVRAALVASVGSPKWGGSSRCPRVKWVSLETEGSTNDDAS